MYSCFGMVSAVLLLYMKRMYTCVPELHFSYTALIFVPLAACHIHVSPSKCINWCRTVTGIYYTKSTIKHKTSQKHYPKTYITQHHHHKTLITQQCHSKTHTTQHHPKLTSLNITILQLISLNNTISNLRSFNNTILKLTSPNNTIL